MIHLTRRRLVGTLSTALLGLGLSALLGVAIGPSFIGPSDVIGALLEEGADTAHRDIVLGVRLPRVALASLVGACLATAGVIFQALLRNPLADPFILGGSGGAALGGVSMLALGGALGLGYWAVPPAAFAGSVLTTALLYLLAGSGGRSSVTHLLLIGVVFNAFASAAIVFLASLSGLAEGSRIFVWLIGSIAAIRLEVIWPVALFLALGLSAALVLSRALNLLALGDEGAMQLGVDVEGTRRWLLLATSLMVGAAVSVSGLIGFVGLIVPHLLRLLIGPDHRLLVPSAALCGAAFLVLTDTTARTLLGGRELPVGAITALMGGPFFLYMLRRGQRRVLSPGGVA